MVQWRGGRRCCGLMERAPRDVGAPRGGLAIECSQKRMIFFLEKPPFTQIYHRPSKILKTEQIWTCIRGWTQSKILVRRTTCVQEQPHETNGRKVAPKKPALRIEKKKFTEVY